LQSGPFFDWRPQVLQAQGKHAKESKMGRLSSALALALTASSAHAFLPTLVYSPALAPLRPAASGLQLFKRAEAEMLGEPGERAVLRSRSVLADTAAEEVKAVKGGAQSEARINAWAAELVEDSASYCKKLRDRFPGVLDEASFIECMSRVVKDKGFNPKTSINLVSTCRDEICRPFTEKLDSMWGEHFNIASLGGFVFCGKTGFGAGMAHSPVSGGKERYM
jgi:hypothetical protein